MTPVSASSPPSGTAVSPAPQASWPRYALLAAVAFSVAVCAANTVARIAFGDPAFDQSWFLYLAQRLLAGSSLYNASIMEVNPPMGVWFSEIPALLAQWLHLSPMLMLKVVTTALILASAGWCTRILNTARLATSGPMLALGFFGISTVELCLISINFAQREHLVVIFALPYLLAAALGQARSLGLGERVALGIAAGAGICFKPQEAFILLCFETLLVISLRRPRRLLEPEVLATVLTICTYALLVRFTTTYFQEVPILGDVYWAYSGPKLPQLRAILLNHKFLLSIFLWICLRKRLRFPLAPIALMAANIGAGIAFAMQGQDWDGHLFPSTALVYCALCIIPFDLAAQALDRLPNNARFAGRDTLGFGLLTVVLLALAVPAFYRHNARLLALQPPPNPHLGAIWAQYPAKTPVFILSTGLGEFRRVFQHDFVWGGRYAHLFMLPAIVQNEMAMAGGPAPGKVLSSFRVQQLAALQRSGVAEDLEQRKPVVVIVWRCTHTHPCQGLGLGEMDFDTLAWFERSSEFAHAWEKYRWKSGDEDFDEYVRVH